MKVRECDKSQTLGSFIRENTECGRAVFEKFGWNQDWIVAREKVPFIRKNGRIYWNIPIESVLMQDVIQTFQLYADSEIEYEECVYYGSCKAVDAQEIKMFIKLWKQEYKMWKHNPGTKRVAGFLRKYLENTEVYPENVFAAIWLETGYILEDFMALFGLQKREADKLLQAAGYVKKKCDDYYLLNSDYKKGIKNCFEKAKEILRESGYSYTKRASLKRKMSGAICYAGEKIQNAGDRLGYQENILARWIEPVIGERNALLNKMTVPLVLILLLAAGLGVGGVFYHKLVSGDIHADSSLLGFWGSVFGAVIAGLVTILTTHWIIERSYKLDYHTERMSVLPVFSVSIQKRHFDTLNTVPDFIKDMKKQYAVYEHEIFEDMMLMKISNIGCGIAFGIKVLGMWGSDEYFSLSEIENNNFKYIITRDTECFQIHICYYDIYGNYYMQKFSSEKPVDTLNDCIVVNGNPPELVMRTKRIRYCQ